MLRRINFLSTSILETFYYKIVIPSVLYGIVIWGSGLKLKDLDVIHIRAARLICKLCKKIYIGETGRRLADRFREHLRDAEQNNTDASKPVARHFNLPNHSHHNMTICGLYLHHGNTESRKNLEQKLIFQLGTLSPHGINERLSFH